MIKQLYRFLNPKFQNVFLDYPVDAKPRYSAEKPHQELYNIINDSREVYADWLGKSLKYKEVFWKIKDMKAEDSDVNPVYNNGFLPGLDIVALYTLVAEIKPEKYIEVGSGNSTKVAALAKRNEQLETQIVSIDPQPRAEIDQLADKVVRKPFESVDIEIIKDLKENDILFIDNSHRILPNSDSMAFFLEVLPNLSKGVIVHIHDIYLPYDYPQVMCDRFYSEQYGLAMYLLANSKRFQTIMPNFFISEDKELSLLISEIWKHENLKGVEQHGGSYWLRIAE